MTREDIIRMAREAGFVEEFEECANSVWVQDTEITEYIERFAALVAAAEREACAKVCEGRIGGAVQTNEWWGGFKSAMKQCAAAIRARGNA